MSTKTIHIFPGAHKTASSLLQYGLEKNRPLFEAEGYSIARRSQYYRSGLRNFLLREGAAGKATADEVTDLLQSVFDGDPRDRNALISIENAFGEIGPNLYHRAGAYIDNIREIFPEHDIKVTLFIRRQDTFLESAYIQSIHRGIEEPVEAFFAPYRETVLDWSSVISPIRRRIGRRNVKVIPYETIRNGSRKYMLSFFRRFSDLPRAELLEHIDLKDADTNLTLSEVGIRLACLGFTMLPELTARRSLVRALQREFGVDKYPRFRIPDDLRRELGERHLAANEKLITAIQMPEPLQAFYRFQE